jgi:broad specificity phosphatase PhoE
MRHGQSEYDILGLCNDDPAQNMRLTAVGDRLAEQAADALKNIPLERIFCSERPRAGEITDAEMIERVFENCEVMAFKL